MVQQYPDYLAHFGIKGMKWGVRRYQNKDGSYTKQGLARRYGASGGSRSSGSSGKARGGSGSNAEARKAKIKKAAMIAAGVAGTAALGYGAYRLAKSGKGQAAIAALRNSKAGQTVAGAAGKARGAVGSGISKVRGSKAGQAVGAGIGRARGAVGSGVGKVRGAAGKARSAAGKAREAAIGKYYSTMYGVRQSKVGKAVGGAASKVRGSKVGQAVGSGIGKARNAAGKAREAAIGNYYSTMYGARQGAKRMGQGISNAVRNPKATANRVGQAARRFGRNVKNTASAAPGNARNAFLNKATNLRNKAYNAYNGSRVSDAVGGIGNKARSFAQRTVRNRDLTVPGAPSKAGRGHAARTMYRKARDAFKSAPGKARGAAFDARMKVGGTLRSAARVSGLSGAAGKVGRGVSSVVKNKKVRQTVGIGAAGLAGGAALTAGQIALNKRSRAKSSRKSSRSRSRSGSSRRRR